MGEKNPVRERHIVGTRIAESCYKQDWRYRQEKMEEQCQENIEFKFSCLGQSIDMLIIMMIHPVKMTMKKEVVNRL